MNKIETFQNFITTQSMAVPVWSFLFNIILAVILSSILAYVYIRYGKSLSNRRKFAQNFVLLTMVTMFIIAVVKSSLALSLGLVGALSIVRFRAAIKEPEELIYLFFTISIGLGLGADQTIITIIAFVVILLTVLLENWLNRDKKEKNYNLIVSSKNIENFDVKKIVEVLDKYCISVDLNRLDKMEQEMEASFSVNIEDFEKFNKAIEELEKINNSIQINFLDNNGLS